MIKELKIFLKKWQKDRCARCGKRIKCDPGYHEIIQEGSRCERNSDGLICASCAIKGVKSGEFKYDARIYSHQRYLIYRSSIEEMDEFKELFEWLKKDMGIK